MVLEFFMIILIKSLLNSKPDLVQTVKQLFRIQIQKGRKVLLRAQVKSRIQACYSGLVLESCSKNRMEFQIDYGN